MKNQLAKLIDLKSIITLVLVLNLVFVMDYVMVTGAKVDQITFTLFSNAVTMVLTFFFTRKKTEDGASSTLE